MKKLLLTLTVSCIMTLAITAFAFADPINVWGDYQQDSGRTSSLRIERFDNEDGTWTWDYYLNNSTGGYLQYFTVGLLHNDVLDGADEGDLDDGVFYEYSAQYLKDNEWNDFDNVVITETSDAASWFFNVPRLASGGQAKFSFTTTLPSYGTQLLGIETEHGAAGRYQTAWYGKESPSAVPEPMSMVLGFMGLSSVAGFKRLRKKA